MAALLVNMVEPRFHIERQWFYHEMAGKYYGWKPFAIAITLIDHPFVMLLSTVFFLAFYWTVGFSTADGSWIYWLDVVEGLVAAHLHDVPVHCKPDEFSIFPAPPGQTCGEYAAEFMKRVTGYINNPNATSNCEYCQYRVGDEFFIPLNMNYDHIWRNFGILWVYIAANLVFLLLGIRYFRAHRPDYFEYSRHVRRASGWGTPVNPGSSGWPKGLRCYTEWFYRELAGKYYGWKPFVISINLVEVPFVLTTITFFFLVFYCTVGFTGDPVATFYTWLLMQIFFLIALTIDEAIAACTPST
ncbi:hypothetical protein BGZ73_007566 [Actinomortierella ambigua]|nr:hypothetical protein BGZ73_007566 [Actinomortierella ambigua]